MADFAPELPNKDPNEYLKYSQGWSDRTAATLFSGLGDIMKIGVTAVDERNKKEIRDDIRTRVDETQDRSIAELHSLTRGVDKIPPEILRNTDKLRRYTEAVQQGSFRESNYWGVLDATARQLRAKYPGYRDHIDATLKEFTGSDPANALIRELRQDAEKALKGKGEDDIEKRRLTMLQDFAKKFGGLPTGWENMSYPQVMELWSGQQRKDYALEEQRSRIQTATAQKTFNQSEAATLASGEWGSIFLDATRKSGSIAAQRMREIEGIRDSVAARGGFAPTPEEAKQYIAKIDDATRALNTEFNTFITTPRAHLGGRSYAMTLSQEQIREIKANQLDAITAEWKAATFDQNLGFIKRAAALAEVYSDTEKYRLLGSPLLRTVAGARSIVGDAAMGIVMLQPGKGLTEVQDLLRQYATVSSMNPSEPTSLKQQVEIIKGKGENKPEVIQPIIQTNVTAMGSKDVPAQVRSALVNTMYGQDNVEFLGLVNSDPKLGGSRASPQRTFQMMANSRAAKAVADLTKETGDPSHWAKYERWVTSQVYALNTIDINTVARAQQNAPGMNIKFDPATMTFSVDEVPLPSAGADSQTPGIAGLRAIANAYESSRISGIRSAVERLNQSFVPLRDIAEYKGVDRTNYALAVLEGIGATAESKDGRESVAQSLITTLARVLYDRPEVKKPKSPTPAPESSELFPNATRALRKASEYSPGRSVGDVISEGGLGRVGRWLTDMLPSRHGVERARSGDLYPDRRRRPNGEDVR